MMQLPPCAACESEERDHLFADANRRELTLPYRADYYQCRRCGLVSINPVPLPAVVDRSYSMLAAAKRSAGPPPGRWAAAVTRLYGYLEHRSTRVHSCMVAPSGRLLDVGCGVGLKLRPYLDAGFEVVGLDTNAEEIGVAKRTFPSARFLQSTLEDCVLPDEFFDLVRIDNVLEHVTRPGVMLGEVRRVLKPHGRLLIYVPRSDSLACRLLGRYHSNFWVPFHIHVFTADALRRLLTRCGFEVEAVRTVQPLSWIGMTLKQWLSRPTYRTALTTTQRLFLCVLFPLSVMLSMVRQGDELMVTAAKRRVVR
jgi:2-polyprenyl-3-methyl-5-hydroxy-6-metoxy-1,4-benzoquinol methylase